VLYPSPVSAIVCGEPPALSLIVMAASSGPATIGVKCPWMVQLAPAARLIPQSFAKTNEDVSGPVKPMFAMERVASPVLVRVTSCDVLVVPISKPPNDRLLAENDVTGATPVPPNVMLCGDPAALSVIEMAAESEPNAAGANCA